MIILRWKLKKNVKKWLNLRKSNLEVIIEEINKEMFFEKSIQVRISNCGFYVIFNPLGFGEKRDRNNRLGSINSILETPLLRSIISSDS